MAVDGETMEPLAPSGAPAKGAPVRVQGCKDPFPSRPDRTLRAATKEPHTMIRADILQQFPGKTIRVIVGYEPGGGFDAYARLLADHLPRMLGAAQGVVSYMPGAATLNAANYINDVATNEGTEIGIPNSGLPLNGFVLNANGALDVTKLNWIGRLDAIDVVCVAWHSVPVKDFSDVKSRGLVLGGTSPTGTSVMTPVALNKLAGAKFRMVLGYKGTTEQYLAMERGEIEGMGNAIWSQLKRSNPKWIDERRITPIYQEGHAPSADLPDVPTVIELAENEDDKRMDVVYRSGGDTMEAGFGTDFGQPAEQHYVINPGTQEKAIPYRRLNGQWPYLPPGLERDTGWSQQGTTGRLEKNGAVLTGEAGRKSYLLADPRSGAVVGYNPLPDPQSFKLTSRDGTSFAADGKVGLLRLEYRPWSREVEISYAPKPDQNGSDMARSIAIEGMAEAPTVTLNGSKVDATRTDKGFQVALS